MQEPQLTNGANKTQISCYVTEKIILHLFYLLTDVTTDRFLNLCNL